MQVYKSSMAPCVLSVCAYMSKFLVIDFTGGLYQGCTFTNAWTVYFHVGSPGIVKSGTVFTRV